MLKKEHIEKIAGLLKIKPADLTTAITAPEEQDITISDDLLVLTTAELETRDQEKISTGKELGYKDIKKAAGLPEEAPSKDPAKLAAAIGTAAVTAAKVPTDKKVQELEEQNRLLVKKVEDTQQEVTTAKQAAAAVNDDRAILTAMPKNRADILGDDELLDVVKMKHVKKQEDGTFQVIGKDGQVLRDPATTKPLDLASGLEKVFTERNWIAAAGGPGGGRGGKDEKPTPGKFSKASEVVADFEAKGISMTGKDSQQIVDKLSELAKADPTFNMNA